MASVSFLQRCWDNPPLAQCLLALAGPDALLRLSCTCRSLRLTLTFEAVPWVRLLLLMRRAATAGHLERVGETRQMPWPGGAEDSSK